jgi:hypothetical protein
MSIVPFTARTCGSVLDTKNPAFSQALFTGYQAFLQSHVGKTPADHVCVEPCVPLTSDAMWRAPSAIPVPSLPPVVTPSVSPSVAPPLASTALSTQDRTAACVKCVYDNRTTASILLGGGCNLCVEVVAPWAMKTYGGVQGVLPAAGATLALPQGQELYDFQTNTNTTTGYAATLQTFRNLPACQQAEWIRLMCGQDQVLPNTSPAPVGQPYQLALYSGTTITETASKAFYEELGFLIGVPIAAVCLIILILAIRRRRRNKSLSDQTPSSAEPGALNNTAVVQPEQIINKEPVIVQGFDPRYAYNTTSGTGSNNTSDL